MNIFIVDENSLTNSNTHSWIKIKKPMFIKLGLSLIKSVHRNWDFTLQEKTFYTLSRESKTHNKCFLPQETKQ